MVAVSIPQQSGKEMKIEIINNEFLWQSNLEYFFYDKSKDLRIKDIL